MDSIQRGAVLAAQKARIWRYVIIICAVVSLFISSLISFYVWRNNYTETERFEVAIYWKAKISSMVKFSDEPNIKTIITPSGKKIEVDFTKLAQSNFSNKFNLSSLIFAFLTTFTISFFALLYLSFLLGKKRGEDERIKGADISEKQILIDKMKLNNEASEWTIAGLPVLKGKSNLHFLYGGSQGVGKSTLFIERMKQVRDKKMKAIIYDPSGEFTSYFYRDGHDVILNPFDDRTANWNPFCELKTADDYESIAASLIPIESEENEWVYKGARLVFRDAIKYLQNNKRLTNKELHNFLCVSNLYSIYKSLIGYPGANQINPASEKTAVSILSAVQTQVEPFHYLPDYADKPVFSIGDFIENDDDRWLFIACREKQRNAIKSLLSVWVDTAILSTLSNLDPIHKERFWFFLDEVPTLQKLNTLSLALTNTRKYGMCCVLGLQDFAQLAHIYGKEIATTLVSGCQTKALLRMTDGTAQEDISKLIGEAEMVEVEESMTYGHNENRDSINLRRSRQVRKSILPSEIRALNDLEGYLITPGNYPVVKFKAQYVQTEKIAPAFVPRIEAVTPRLEKDESLAKSMLAADKERAERDKIKKSAPDKPNEENINNLI
jgi:type IV conjugative transfer system coupling protein TraD